LKERDEFKLDKKDEKLQKQKIDKETERMKDIVEKQLEKKKVSETTLEKDKT
jgi:preprotein translocase subunit SecD